MTVRIRQAIALEAELGRHAPLLGPRDPSQPDVWFRWCTCGWDGGRSEREMPDVYRRHVAASLLAALDEVMA